MSFEILDELWYLRWNMRFKGKLKNHLESMQEHIDFDINNIFINKKYD